MKKRLSIMISGALLTMAPLAMAADSYPNRPIRLIVPWAAGGATDVIARLVGKNLGEQLGQPVVVENKGGAGGNIGTASMLREKADGYALVMTTSSTHAANQHLYHNIGFDAVEDFTHVALVGSIPNILVVPPNSPFNEAKDLISYAKENPGKLNYGSAGVGSSQHLAAAQLVDATGIDMVHIPYKGSGPAAADLLAGQLDLMLDTGSMNHIKGGNLKALAVASKERLVELPELPTLEEQGVKDMYAAAWYGVAAPKGTPADVVEKLNVELTQVMQNPDIIERLQALGVQVSTPKTPEELQVFVQQEVDRFGELIEKADVKIE